MRSGDLSGAITWMRRRRSPTMLGALCNHGSNMKQLLENADAKKHELESLLAARLADVHPDLNAATTTTLAADLLQVATSISPPQEEEPVIHFVTLSMAGRRGGSSVKPGNILLDVRKLLTSIGKIGLASVAVAVAVNPWIAAFAVLVLWDDLYSRAKVDIQEREASVIWTIWIHKNDSKCIAKDGLLELVNQERSNSGRSALTQDELDDALGILIKMRCIAESRQDSSNLWVKEWVSINYK
jgi:hypothetical protein